MTNNRSPFFYLTVICSALIMAYLLVPLAEMVIQPSWEDLRNTFFDPDVRKAIGLSLGASLLAAVICFAVGTPFAYLLARREFTGKKLLESIIDLPIMIPHPVIGIAILGIAGKNHWIGQALISAGIRVMGSITGIVLVLIFVGLPFYVNSAKNGFEAVSPRLEKASRTLGATMGSTFLRVTFPLAWRSMLTGIIMATARALSEFGAIVIVAYHPMTAPVLIYERFTAYGLKYSQPVAVWLIFVSLILFASLRLVSRKGRAHR